jgi:hypothetical protein
LFSCVLGCFNASVSVNVGHYVITLGSRSQVPKCAALDPFYFFTVPLTMLLGIITRMHG